MSRNSSVDMSSPDESHTSGSLRCEQCGGMTFTTTQELAVHNRKEHGMG